MNLSNKASIKSSDWAVKLLPADQQLSKKQLIERASQVARLLRARKVKRVAFLMENRLECPELILGARWSGVDYLVSGADYLLAGVRLSRNQLLAMLEDFEADMVIISDAHSSIGEWLAERLPATTHRLIMGKSLQGWSSYALARDQQSSEPLTKKGTGELHPLSGGSSGKPKIIKTPIRLDGKPNAIQNILTPGKDGVVLISGPIYRNLQLRALLAALICGARVIILQKWDKRLFLQTIQDLRVTHVNITPTTMSQLLELKPAEQKHYNLSSLKQVIHTAGPCPDYVKRQFIDWLGDRLVEVYAMAERFGGTIIRASEWLEHPGSVGRPFPGCQVVIRSETGESLPSGEIGMVWFAQTAKHTRMTYVGRDSSAAYYNEYDEATAKDMGYLDADGYLYITGRATRVIGVGGVNVFPEATEKLLAGQPMALDAWVFGVPDRVLGEKLFAFVQLRSGTKPTEKLANRLIALCKTQLGDYAAPMAITFVDKLPRDEAGKMNPDRIAEMQADIIKILPK